MALILQVLKNVKTNDEDRAFLKNRIRQEIV